MVRCVTRALPPLFLTVALGRPCTVVAQDIAQRFVGLITHRQLLHDWTLAFIASCLVGLSSLDLRYPTQWSTSS